MMMRFGGGFQTEKSGEGNLKSGNLVIDGVDGAHEDENGQR